MNDIPRKEEVFENLSDGACNLYQIMNEIKGSDVDVPVWSVICRNAP